MGAVVNCVGEHVTKLYMKVNHHHGILLNCLKEDIKDLKVDMPNLDKMSLQLTSKDLILIPQCE